MTRKLLLVADFAVDTGFAQVAHNIADRLEGWDISVLAINYYGDPHPYQKKYTLFNPSIRGDLYGYNRIKSIIKTIEPDLIFIINDPWICSQYVTVIGETNIPIVVYIPVDGLNLRDEFVKPLNHVSHVIAYTEFAKQQLIQAGLTIPISIIPHGVDTDIFYPVKKQDARAFLNIPHEWYIVNITDRNSLRKRIDLGISYFAAWVQDKPEHIKLYYHGSLHDGGWNILNLASFYGIESRIMLTSPNITPDKGIPKEVMRYVYSAADIGISTSMGEGWGLTAHERMACGLPMILPCHSAYSEWPLGAVEHVTCSSTFANINGLNTIGFIADKEAFIESLNHLYTYPDYRDMLSMKGLQKATEERFNWNSITAQFTSIFQDVTTRQRIEYDSNT